ncbi:MAG: J domain-containing protein [Candidatus Woesearchaeota archaeon]
MTLVKIKENEINTIIIKDSFNRRAIQFRNNIIILLSKISVIEDDIDIPMENVALKKAPASVSWYFDNHHLYYSYNACNKFVENLYVVQKLLELEINKLIDGEQAVEDFVEEFREEQDITDKRKDAREILGLKHDELDIGIIDKAYKNLAKEHHPDKPEGDVLKFKEINHAHKILKRELM